MAVVGIALANGEDEVEAQALPVWHGVEWWYVHNA